MKIIEILEEFRKIFANERDKGTAFEKIVKIYLENEPKYGCGQIFRIEII